MKRILITGISGFIGGHVWATLANREGVFGIYGSTGTVPYYTERQFHADMNVPDSLDKIIRQVEPDCIIHLAAVSRLKICQENGLLAWRVNHAATRHISKLAEELDARLIFTSTDQVFDGNIGNYKESDPINPLHTYGETKKASERTVASIVSNAVIARLNNCYGPPMFRGSSFSEWILNRQKQCEPITLFHDQFRSPIDVVSLTKALVELIDNPFTGTLHIGGANRINRVQFGRLLLTYLEQDATGILEMSQTKIDPDGILPRDTSYNISLAQDILETHIPGVEEGIALAYGQQKRMIF